MFPPSAFVWAPPSLDSVSSVVTVVREMLANVLDAGRERAIAELERRAAVTEGPGMPARGRRERLNAYVGELIGVLRRGGLDDKTSLAAATVEPALERQERELVRRFAIEQIEQHPTETSREEQLIVLEWASQSDRRRLLEHNQRLRALLDGIDEGAAILAPDGRILYVNRRVAHVLYEASGIAPDEIVGKTPAELELPSDLGIARPADELLSLARAKDSFEVVAWGRAKENRFDALYAPDGTVAAIALLTRDVQPFKLAQSRIGLLSKLGALIGTVDYDEVAQALARVPIPELADWCVFSVIQNKRILRAFIAQRDPAKAPIRDALARGAPAWDRHPLWQEMLTGGFQLLGEVSDDLLRRLATSDEQYRLLSLVGIRSLMVIPVASRGQIAGIITLAYTTESGRRYGRDDPALAEEVAVHASHIVENARLMKELKSSEARFRIALAGARTAVFEQDASLRYVFYYNAASPFTMVGKTHEDMFPPDQATLLNAMKTRVLETGESVFEEMDLTIGGAEKRHYLGAVEPLRDRFGRIVGVVGAATDITEQQRTQQQLEEALGFRERMMGILGHDLRNPLTTIIMADGLLLKRQDLAPAARDQVLRIRHAADRMQEMINTLLDFTRARFLGKVPVSPEPADLGEIAHGVVDELRVAWPEHDIELDVRGDAHGKLDPGRIAEVISNLVGNAITYGDPKTPVRVSVDGTGGAEMVLRVSNHGPPIPADLMPVLFEPFRRGVPEDRSPRGLGLGLYIVQQIVLAHDGTIDVDSTAQEGTTFTARLPRSPASSKKDETVSPTVH
jgi:signal transduction histidine kinase